MNTTHPHDPDLCRVCVQRPVSTDGICDACRPPWRDSEPRWNWLEAALHRWTWLDVEAALALARAILERAEPLLEDGRE